MHVMFNQRNNSLHRIYSLQHTKVKKLMNLLIGINISYCMFIAYDTE